MKKQSLAWIPDSTSLIPADFCALRMEKKLYLPLPGQISADCDYMSVDWWETAPQSALSDTAKYVTMYSSATLEGLFVRLDYGTVLQLVPVEEYERQVWEIEGIRIVCRTPTYQRVPEYTQQRCPDSTTVGDWLKPLQKHVSCQIAVVTSNFGQAHPNALLGTLRSRYNKPIKEKQND